MFDLEMNLVDHGNDILIECTYNKDLFEAATIKRWLRHWKTLLSAVAIEPRQTIGLVEILDAEQRRRVLEEWNDTRVAYPNDKMIHELFEAQVERSPEAVAVVHEGQQVTYRELNRRANQLAHYLRKMGIGPEVLVGICCRPERRDDRGIVGYSEGRRSLCSSGSGLSSGTFGFHAEGR